jgi:arabinofuranosyltransferase
MQAATSSPAADTPPHHPTTAWRDPRTSRAVRVAVLLVPILFLVVVAWSRRWTFEDAFLNYRVVDQIRAGHGAVFNVGQRVEVTTSTLWLGLLLVVRSVFPFVRIELSSILTGLVLSALGLWWAQRAAGIFWRGEGEDRLLVPFGALIFVAIAASWDWSTSGLENGLSFAWLGATALVLARVATADEPRSPRFALFTGFVVGLGPLVRPDLAVMSVVCAAAVVWMRRKHRAEVLVFVAGGLALPVVVELVRMGYYAQLVPNTALAKAASSAYWHQGWRYLLDFLQPYWLVIPLVTTVAVFVVLVRTEVQVPVVGVLALPVAGVLHALYITRTGGDYVHARLLLPSLFAFLAPFAALPWSRRLAVPVLVVGIWVIICVGWLRPVDVRTPFAIVTKGGTNDARAQAMYVAKPRHRPVNESDFRATDGQLARRLEREGRHALVAPALLPAPLFDATPGRTTLVSTSAGVSGYQAGPDVIVHEANALADLVGSHMPPLPHSLAGHRKRESWEWIIAMTTRPGVTAGRDPATVDAGRRAMQCGELADLLAATSRPLTIGRFFSNLVDAPGWSRLDVPRDEQQAEQEFCGRG